MKKLVIAATTLILMGCTSIENQNTYQLCRDSSLEAKQELMKRGIDPNSIECTRAHTEAQADMLEGLGELIGVMGDPCLSDPTGWVCQNS